MATAFYYTYTHIKTICNVKTIQELIDSGVITTEQVLRYADDYYISTYQEHWTDLNLPYEQELAEKMDYEGGYRERPDIPFPTCRYPEYVVVSTNYDVKETMVFPADERGKIIDFGDILCHSEEWHVSWEDQTTVVSCLNTDEHTYRLVRHITREPSPIPCLQTLWKKEISS